MAKIALTDFEFEVLQVLDAVERGCCLSFAGIANRLAAPAERNAIRAACRRLRDVGYATFERALWTYDGAMAGAGYGITPTGAVAVVARLGAAEGTAP